MTRDTSLAAYDEFCRSGKLARDTKMLLKALVRAGRPVADFELAAMLKWEQARVSARRNDLTNESNTGAIVSAGYTKNPHTGKTVRTWPTNLSNNLPML